VTLEAASSELQVVASALEREYPNTNSAVSVRADRLADRLVSEIRLTLIVLLGAVGFLLGTRSSLSRTSRCRPAPTCRAPRSRR
jgi:hypothetical protein